MAVPDPKTKNATLRVVRPKPAKDDPIPLCFNPTDYQIQKQNVYQEVPIPGTPVPPLQYIRGGSEKLTFDALVDTSDSMTSVFEKYVKRLRALLDRNDDIHAPPVVELVWGTFTFIGVIESLNITYTLFSDAGVPVRAKLSFVLKQYGVDETAKAIANAHSADVEKTYVVKRGDTLSGIAERSYGSPAPWREIARANGIADPRVLVPGQVLTLPRLESAS